MSTTSAGGPHPAAIRAVPILANLSAFRQPLLFTVAQLATANVAIALEPMSAFRAMNAGALKRHPTLRREGRQKSMVAEMQTQAEQYRYLDCHWYEESLDRVCAQRKEL